LLCLLGTVRVFAQDPKTDSLELLLRSLPQDTQRVNVLNEVADRLRGTRFQDALDYVNEAMDLADSLNFVSGLATALVGHAELQSSLGAYESSMKSALSSYDRFLLLGNSNGMARALNSLGLVQNHLKQYDKAITTIGKAIRCYEIAKNQRGALSAKHNLAVIHTSKGDTAKAKAQYAQNLKSLQGTNYWGVYAATYNNLGNLLPPTTAGDSAILFYELALQYKAKAKLPSLGSIGNTIMNIANVHLKRGELAQAEARLLVADSLVQRSQEKVRILQLHDLWGELYYKMGRYKESAEHYELQTVVQDSLFAPQMTEQAARLEAAYQSENQKKEIALLNQSKALDEAEKTRWRWIAAGIGSVLVLCVALLLLLVLRGRERSRMMKLLQQKNGEIKRQQQEIVLQNEALSIQNKRLADVNNDKDGLIGVVAHDIRAPLNRSAALAELITNIGDLNPEQEKYLQMIRKVSEEGGRLIQDLLELNSYESHQLKVEWQPVDLADVVEHALHGFGKATAEKQISLHWEPQPATAVTDEKLLGRILDNVVSNAVKFTPKGKGIHLRIVTDADLHWIEVRDEGPGISAEDQRKMFQKFQRLSARPTGGESSTGLGLSIVRALSDRIGAKLVFESSLGTGTTFKIGIRKGS
jgi:signal transduction histidine kinase